MSENLSSLLLDIGENLNRQLVKEGVQALLLQNLNVRITHVSVDREMWLIVIKSNKITISRIGTGLQVQLNKQNENPTNESSSVIEFNAFESELSNYDKNEVPCFPFKKCLINLTPSG